MTELEEEKLFYERFYALHGDAQLLSLLEKFSIGLFRRSCVLEGFEAFLKQVNFRGKRCVEIGSCNGLTAVVLARYFDEVVSIDNAPSELKHQVLDYLKVRNVRFIDVANNERKADVISAMEFDAAFSDGDHAADTYTDFSLVRKCRRVLFHEYWKAQAPVWNLVNSFPPETVTTKGKFALWIA